MSIETEWISVQNRCPSEDEYVWCYWEEREILIAQYNADQSQGASYGFYSLEDCKTRCATRLRKSQRICPNTIKKKTETVVERWNRGSLQYKNEGFELDIENIIKDFNSGVLGLRRLSPD